MKAISRAALCAILVASMCVAPARAQDKPAPSPSPTPVAVDVDKPDTPEYKEAANLSKQFGGWMEEYSKTKKPSLELGKKIDSARGKYVVVSGFLESRGSPLILRVGSVDYQGGVDYIFNFAAPDEMLRGLAVYVRCAGIVRYIDTAKKIVILDHATVRWLGAD